MAVLHSFYRIGYRSYFYMCLYLHPYFVYMCMYARGNKYDDEVGRVHWLCSPLRLVPLDMLDLRQIFNMLFPTIWYVWPAKLQIHLSIRTVWSEPLLVAWIFYECLAFCLFVLLLYVPRQPLWSWRNGQFTYPHFYLGKLEQAVNQYFVHILSLVHPGEPHV